MNKSLQNIEDSERGQNPAPPCQAYKICMQHVTVELVNDICA